MYLVSYVQFNLIQFSPSFSFHSFYSLFKQFLSTFMMKFLVYSAIYGLSSVSAYTVTNAPRFMLKNIDPIVFPGQYVSHMHSFFGSDAVTANTTTSKELQNGCSTAENPNDYSSYCRSVFVALMPSSNS